MRTVIIGSIMIYKKMTEQKYAVITGLITFILLTAVSAHAKIAVKASSGWEFSTDGFVNAFAVYEDWDEAPANVAGGLLLGDRLESDSSFRVRTGLLPSCIAFNVNAPKTKGLDLAARVGFYPQIQNSSTRTQFGSQIDLREVFATVGGDFGQFLFGRALYLYQGKNILTDMSLFGVGVQGGPRSGGTTLGGIGYGYIYTNFGAQFRYTTPDLSGLKIALGITDPSQIAGSGLAATKTDLPGFEAEISYSAKFDSGSFQAWVSGMYQKAEFADKTSLPSNHDGDVEASGGAAGAGLNISGFDILASGFSGQGLGSSLLLDIDSLDSTGKERDSFGFMVQTGYTFGATRVGIKYGQNTIDETQSEEEAREAGGVAQLEKQTAWTFGMYHTITDNFKLMVEYTKATNEWFGGQNLESNIFTVGTFFVW